MSGISAIVADNIISYRSQAGKFKSRSELLKVPRLGDKAYEQCAGFLRIPNGDDLLDASAVHPEAYSIVKAMADDLKLPVHELIGNETILKGLSAKKYVSDAFGEHTINDIIKELKKPGT